MQVNFDDGDTLLDGNGVLSDSHLISVQVRELWV